MKLANFSVGHLHEPYSPSAQRWSVDVCAEWLLFGKGADMGRVRPSKEVVAILAKKLRGLREEQYPGRGGSRKFAADINVLPQQWSQWETGKRVPVKAQLQKIADYFGIDVEELLPKNIAATVNSRAQYGYAESVAIGELLELIGTLCHMQAKALQGADESGKFAAIVRDMVKFANYVMYEHGVGNQKLPELSGENSITT